MTGIGGDCFALDRQAGARQADRAQRRGPRARGGDRGVARQVRAHAHRAHQPACRDGAGRHRRLDAAGGRLRHHAAVAPAGAGHRAGRAGLRGGAARGRRLGADEARISHHAGARAHLFKDGRVPREGEVMRFPALARTLRIIAKEGREGFYARRGGGGHRGRAQRAGRPAHARGFRRPARQLRDADLGALPRRGAVGAAAQQPGHRGADGAQDAGAPRPAGRPGLGRALPRAAGGGPPRLRHARYLRRRPRHGRRAGRRTCSPTP